MKAKKREFKPTKSECAFIGAVLFVVFFVLWFLWSAIGNKFIELVGGSEHLASWVQALGSIAAIFGAAAGTRWQISKQMHIAKEGELRSYIHMSEISLEMCNAIFSIMNDKESSSKNTVNIKFKSLVFGIDYPIDSLVRLDDLQENLRLIIAKDLPLELMKSLFQLQKIIAKYKEFIQMISKEHKIHFSDENKYYVFCGQHRNMRNDINKEIYKILEFKNEISNELLIDIS
nr:hypothetical protein [uncultured Comamonas sp.]